MARAYTACLLIHHCTSARYGLTISLSQHATADRPRVTSTDAKEYRECTRPSRPPRSERETAEAWWQVGRERAAQKVYKTTRVTRRRRLTGRAAPSLGRTTTRAPAHTRPAPRPSASPHTTTATPTLRASPDAEIRRYFKVSYPI